MQKGFKPNTVQKQIQQRIMNTQHKGRCFFQIYSNKEQVHAVMNAFELLPADQIRKIIASLTQMQQEDNLDQEMKDKLNQCWQYCINYQVKLNMFESERKQRNCNSICLLMCCGINIACIFGLWEMIFLTSSSDVFEGSIVEQVQNSGEVLQKPEQSINFVYLTEMIVYIGLKLLSGFWAVFGCLFSGFCVFGCVSNYFKSFKHEFDQRRMLKERLEKNRKNELIEQKND